MANDPATRDGRASVQSVDRAISILHLLARHGQASVSEIATQSGLNKTTVFRLLATMEAWGLVEQNRVRGRYQLGFGVVQLAAGATKTHDLSLLRQEACFELAESVGETVNVAIHDGHKVIIIDQVIGSVGVTTVNWVGQRMPMHATAAGKVFLAHMPSEQLEAILSQGLERYTSHTIVDPDALKQEMIAVCERGYATTVEEHEIGLATVAAPIRSLDGQVVAAVAVSGPKFRLNEDRIHDVAQQVIAATAKISRRSGYAHRG